MRAQQHIRNIVLLHHLHTCSKFMCKLCRSMKKILLLLALTLATPSHAGMDRADRALNGLRPGLIQVPPIRFQATGHLFIQTMPRVTDVCTTEGAVACAIGTVIVMPDPCDYPRERYAALLCHESAHALSKWRHEAR